MATAKSPDWKQKLKEEIEKKHGKPAEQLFQERQQRFYDAIQMKVPDRVPVIWGGTFFPCKYAGLPYSAAYYDAPAWRDAYIKMMVDFDPDAFGGTITESGDILSALETNYTKWPGGNLPDNVGFQVVEQEYMKADEYDLFITDPSDFMLRYWLPRVFNALQPLAKLPPLTSVGNSMAGITSLVSAPEFTEMVKAIKKAADADKKWKEDMGNLQGDLNELGWPSSMFGRGGVQPPFSGFTNSFRTFKGAVSDMFRQPDKLKAGLETMLEYRMARATPAVKVAGKPTVGNSGEAHRVSDEILSKRQFEEFVWPNWKRAIEKTYELGYEVISMFFEGRRDKQLEYFLDFPKGGLLIRFAETDIFRAKEILGDKAVIMGNVPIQMLQMGSTQDVEEYTKKLINICGKNGGFILRCSTDYTQEAKPENVKAMIDTVKEYGRY